MAIYLHVFDTASAFTDAYNGSVYIEPWTSYTKENENVKYNKKPWEYPITFKCLTGGTLSLGSSVFEVENGNHIGYYSINGGEWTKFSTASVNSPFTLNLAAGDEVGFKANTVSACDSSNYTMFGGNAECDVYGNVMSLLFKDDFSERTSFHYSGDTWLDLRDLFWNVRIWDAGDLILPATELSENCYKQMFCLTNIRRAPMLPATTVPYMGYFQMFLGCPNLTTAPELPATTLGYQCYGQMFSGCQNLTSAPEKLPAMTLANMCYNNMFERCTSLQRAPELPALTLVEQCYNRMFAECGNLNYIQCMATDISADLCTYMWAQSVQTTSGTFIKNPAMSSWTSGDSGIPTNWTVQNA